jgi:hypothetical protein
MRLGFLAFTLALGALFAAPASADPIVAAGDKIRFADGAGTTGGGEFVVTINDSWSFVTFCLQRTEYVDFKHEFTVDSVNSYTLTDPSANGGDSLGRDYISPQTAFLYTMFSKRTLPGYAYTGSGHSSSADTLQKAFWMLEGELPTHANRFVQLANYAVSSGQWSGIGDVRVMNLSLDGKEAQDQLAILPTPEPGTMLLIGSGLGIAALRRRRTRRA